MAVDPEILRRALVKARPLMDPSLDGVNIKDPQTRKNAINRVQETYNPIEIQAPQTSPKLPRAIMEEFRTNVIPDMVAPSLTDNAMLDIERQLFSSTPPIKTNQNQQPTMLRESFQPQQGLQNNNVDYSLIKTIVEECVSRHIQNFKTENEIVVMKIGGTMQYVDRNGNIFEAKLTKKGTMKP